MLLRNIQQTKSPSSVKIFMVSLCLIFASGQIMAANKAKCQSSLYMLESVPEYDHARYAPTPVERFYDGKAFVSSLDGNDDDDEYLLNGDPEGEYLIQPQWVAVHIKGYLNQNGEAGFAPGYKRPKWYKIPEFNIERSKMGLKGRIDDSYRGVGKIWNRGHYAQRSDANRMGPEYGCNTHVFANAFPQHADLNQGIWLGLEFYISSLANQVGDVWVVTGPIFTKAPEFIGDKDEVPVAVPDKVFKVLVWNEGENTNVISFIYPNHPGDEAFKTGRCSADKTYDHTLYLSTIYEIETKTGLTFFGEGNEEFKKQMATQLPPVEEKYRVGNCI